MEESQKVAILLARAEEVRRLALDELDTVARQTSTWGSKEHRDGRDKVEASNAAETLRLQRLDTAALDLELAQ
ncbi:MAG: hypothetical protein AB7N24_08770 [Dehalococcoidia bacterium]